MKKLDRKNRAERLRGLTLREQLEASIELENQAAQRMHGVERALGQHRARHLTIKDAWQRGGGDESSGSRPGDVDYTWGIRAAWGAIGLLIVLGIMGVYGLLRWLGW